MYMSYGTFTKRRREFIIYLSVLRRYYNNIIHLWAYTNPSNSRFPRYCPVKRVHILPIILSLIFVFCFLVYNNIILMFVDSVWNFIHTAKCAWLFPPMNFIIVFQRLFVKHRLLFTLNTTRNIVLYCRFTRVVWHLW